MSKYDDFNYETFSEREKKELPSCIKHSSLDYSNKVPEELLGISVEQLKKILNIKFEDEQNFNFANNNQTKVDRDYMFNDHFIRGKKKMDMMLTLSFIIMLSMAKGHIKNNQKNIRSLVN